MEKVISGDKVKEIRYNDTSKAILEVELVSGVVLEFSGKYYHGYDVTTIECGIITDSVWKSK